MINLENKCVLARTVEEYEKIMEEAIKQGFNKCRGYGDICSLYSNCVYILRFYKDKTYTIDIYPSLEASKLLGTKEPTARELIDFITNVNHNCIYDCENCVLSKDNTKCKRDLCISGNWVKGSEEELISIAKSGKTTIKSEREKTIETLEQFISDSVEEGNINKAIKYAIDNLKKEGK